VVAAGLQRSRVPSLVDNHSWTLQWDASMHATPLSLAHGWWLYPCPILFSGSLAVKLLLAQKAILSQCLFYV
jgi:hypothetical protein